MDVPTPPRPTMPSCPFCSKEVPTGSSICPHCLRAMPIEVMAARPTPPKKPIVPRGSLRALVLLVPLVAVGAYGLREYRRVKATPEPVLLAEGEEPPVTGPVTTTIAPPLEVPIADSASVPIAARGHLAYTFSGSGRAGCRVHGTVQGLGRGERRIDVFVVDRDGLADLENGRPPRTYYDSGALSDVTLDISLDGRSEYTLVVRNEGKRPAAVRMKGVGASCAD